MGSLTLAVLSGMALLGILEGVDRVWHLRPPPLCGTRWLVPVLEILTITACIGFGLGVGLSILGALFYGEYNVPIL